MGGLELCLERVLRCLCVYLCYRCFLCLCLNMAVLLYCNSIQFGLWFLVCFGSWAFLV